ncbi:hypothetical protein J2751_002804 [Halorubrum alkaliphilum]|uniref:DUF7282 domain-containing protein n=1 Tax=Halorubrum alkaliphilum TaxID=261290 RepID=A0A8T4GJ63_9EURY|nr:hypothetical protein [Halorubrum alkaliphilum]MBP1923759.1 hypothetical protein [Halorubrum alkaliphilum]
MLKRPIRRRQLLKSVAGTSVALAVGTGTANASHDPDEFRIEFNRQTRRLNAKEPSVLVARADLPERGFVMVHDTHDMEDMSESGCPDTHEIYGKTDVLDPGHYGGMKVPLTDVPAAPGTEELVAMIHTVDDGDQKECPPEVREKADVKFISPGRSR